MAKGTQPLSQTAKRQKSAPGERHQTRSDLCTQSIGKSECRGETAKCRNGAEEISSAYRARRRGAVSFGAFAVRSKKERLTQSEDWQALRFRRGWSSSAVQHHACENQRRRVTLGFGRATCLTSIGAPCATGMAKSRAVYVCQNCALVASRWQGRCDLRRVEQPR
jgi:hypothetical protein